MIIGQSLLSSTIVHNDTLGFAKNVTTTIPMYLKGGGHGNFDADFLYQWIT